MTKTNNYEGVVVQYDDVALHKWSVMKQLASGTGTFDAFDKILCGKADEVAEKLGDSVDKMSDLVNRIATIEGNAAKN